MNAFVQRQQGSPLSYRYHPLLRAVLQAELNNSPDVDAAELRRITAEWHNSHGHNDEAAQLTVTSGDWSMASSLIVNNLGIARLPTWPYGFSLAKLFHHAPRGDPCRKPARRARRSRWRRATPTRPHRCLSQAREGIQERAPERQCQHRPLDRSIRSRWRTRAASGQMFSFGRREAEGALANQFPDYRDGLSELRAVILWHKGTALIWTGDFTAAAAT